VKGLENCHVCDERVTSWQKAKMRVKINPLVLSLGGAFDALLDPLLPQPKKSTTKTRGEVCEDVEDECFFADEDQTDDEGNRHVHWYSDDLFHSGLPCSVVLISKGNTSSSMIQTAGPTNVAEDMENHLVQSGDLVVVDTPFKAVSASNEVIV
jgi:hypothetical protein